VGAKFGKYIIRGPKKLITELNNLRRARQITFLSFFIFLSQQPKSPETKVVHVVKIVLTAGVVDVCNRVYVEWEGAVKF
jgi:hypothetical protein